MSRRPPPRRIELDGEEVVVLSPDDFDRLDGSRRQVGAINTRLSQMSQRLAALEALLEAVENGLAAGDVADGELLRLVRARPRRSRTTG